MIRKLEKLLGEKGSMMVEALAMLGLISMVTPVLYKKAAERTTELQDINAASQMRTLSKAMDDMIKDHYSDLGNKDNNETLIEFENGEASFGTTDLDIKQYLPAGFNLEQNKLFDDYQMRIIRNVAATDIPGSDDVHISLTGLVVAPALENNQGNNFNTRAAKIASMIGANGGVTKDDNINGVQGIWQLKAGDYGLDGLPNNSVAATSLHAINADSGVGAEDVLYRVDKDGDKKYNTMSTTLFLGNNDMREVHRIIADSSKDNKLIIGAVNAQNDDPDTIYNDDELTEANLLVKGIANVSQKFSVGEDGENAILFAGLDGTNPFAQFRTDPATYLRLTGNQKIETKTDGEINMNAGGKTTIDAKGIDITSDSQDLNIKTIGGGANGYIRLDSNRNIVSKSLGTTSFTAWADNDKLELGSMGISATTKNGGITLATNEVDNKEKAKQGQILLNAESLINLDSEDIMELHANNEVNITSGTDIMLSSGSAITIDGPDTYINANGYLHLTHDGKNGGEIRLLYESDHNSHVTLDENMVEMGSGDQKIQVNGADRFVRFAGTGSSSSGAVGVHDGYAFMKTGTDNDRDGGATIYLSGDENRGHAYIKAGNNKALVAVEQPSSDGGQVTLRSHEYGINMSSYVDNTIKSSLQLHSDATLKGDDIILDGDGEIRNIAPVTKFYESGSDVPVSNNSVLNNGIVINHKGMIALPMATGTKKTELAATNGKQDIAGYIKADRLLSNVEYKYPLLQSGDYTKPTSGNGGYDAYQVNPAYTSVMHDIKLTTRGGARLSDILPDFINKGIYVIDNTYREDSQSWEGYTVNTSGEVSGHGGECATNDHNCITTPWLGFVPAPQCPPGYVKVIAINPIRWKMADAYSIAIEPTEGDVSQKFRNYFIQHTNPTDARFELEETDGSSGSHTHEVAQGMPLTFQTNTWLNTTISGYYENNTAKTGTFYGWHAIMGFLYHGSEYLDYLQKVNPTGSYEGKIIWNIFPVYNEELAAVTNVYCYFERRTMDGNNNATGWEWDSDLVDNSYDQIQHFRAGYNSKPSDYVDRLNDPALGYTEPW